MRVAPGVDAKALRRTKGHFHLLGYRGVRESLVTETPGFVTAGSRAGKELVSRLGSVLVAVLALLLSALAVEAYARLFNYLAKKQEDKA